VTRSLPASLEPHGEPFVPVQPMNPFLVDPPALPAEQHMQSSIPEPGPGLSELAQPHP
jgi:hypothetical protein